MEVIEDAHFLEFFDPMQLNIDIIHMLNTEMQA